MKNRTLSLLIGTALTIPSLAMAAPETTAAVDMQDSATATTLEADVGVADNESVSNQSKPFQISETQRISKASVNSNANQQLMAPELQAQQQQQAMQLEQDAMQDPQESMPQQDPQQAMLEEEALLESQEELQQAPQEDEDESLEEL